MVGTQQAHLLQLKITGEAPMRIQLRHRNAGTIAMSVPDASSSEGDGMAVMNVVQLRHI